ncbi:hypothetical protein ABT340_31930 [Streptosporangium sp. NPDC000239]|uniref:hypothetical protein n=1 Tax=Streptosporangium sp. NPDC000239 TaxID=3154248 RepID=UPI003327942B
MLWVAFCASISSYVASVIASRRRGRRLLFQERQLLAQLGVLAFRCADMGAFRPGRRLLGLGMDGFAHVDPATEGGGVHAELVGQ